MIFLFFLYVFFFCNVGGMRLVSHSVAIERSRTDIRSQRFFLLESTKMEEKTNEIFTIQLSLQ